MPLLAILTGLVLFLQAGDAGSEKGAPHTPKFAMRLYAAAESVQPGEDVAIAAEIEVEKKWHVYHPITLGTGLPTRIRFTGPPGVSVSNLQFPAPTLGSLADIEYLELKDKFVV